MTQDSTPVSLLELLRTDTTSTIFEPDDTHPIINEMRNRVDPLVQFKPNVQYLIKDPLFVFRGDPRFMYHDALGYKNYDFTERKQVLVLGNSQVHSLNCPPHETWPSLFQHLAQVETYNAAMGSFSIVQNFLSARELLPLKPDLILCVYYTGNNTVNSLPTLRKSQYGLQRMFNSFDDSVCRNFINPDLDPLKSLARDDRVVEFLRWAKSEEEHYVTAKIGNYIHYTVPAIRSNPQNIHDPYVEAAFTVAKEAMVKLHKLAQKHTKYGLFLLIMPTKELVLFNRYLSYGDVTFSSDKHISTLHENETRIIESLKHHCNDHKIPILDPLESLTDNMSLPIYNPLDVDGHPSLEGKVVLAKYVMNYMSSYVPNK